MSKTPIISVVMPVFNCEHFIREAVDSILNQTFTNFEFIIIDDCSNDRTVEILKSYTDQRIKLILKPKNTGYTNSLNYGISIANGKYIARMDGDDICLATRLEKQFAFLENNVDYILCGTFFSIINTNEILIVPEDHDEIKVRLLKKNCFGHPTIMFRKDIIQYFNNLYDTKKEPAEDYDLWVRLINIGKLYNLQEVLLKYRIHENQVSFAKNKLQKAHANEAKLLLLKNLNVSLSEFEKISYLNIINWDISTKYYDLNSFINIKQKLLVANSHAFFNQLLFQNFLNEAESISIKKYFLSNTENNPLKFLRYSKIRHRMIYHLPIADELKMFIKCIIFYKKK